MTIFDPSSALARGIAYSFPQKWLRLNVPASKMGGGIEGEPSGFSDWLLRSHGLPSSEYAPRFLYGNYLTELLGDLTNSGNCETKPVEVTAIRKVGDSGYRISGDGVSFDADIVVLCTGHLPPNKFLPDHPRIIGDVWAPNALDEIDPDDKLLVVGTGATAVDVVLTLHRSLHRGLITMISPHGNLPIVDAAEAEYPDFFRLHDGDLRPLTVLRRLRSEIARAEKSGDAWQNVLDSFRHHVRGIWQRWSPRERKQFLRHGAQTWLVHRHRLPSDVAELMQSFVASKKLEIRRARYRSLKEVQGGFEVQLAERAVPKQIIVNRIINTTGPSLAFNSAKTPLYRQLFSENMASQNPMGMGLQVDDASQLVDGHGHAQSGLYVLGSATRGHFWEVTGAPDIRLSASLIADHIGKVRFNGEFDHTTRGVAERVTKIVSQQLDVSSTTVTKNTSFIVDLGANSLDLVELVMALEEEFHCEIPEEAAETILTVGDAIQCIHAQTFNQNVEA
ncbi:acyl carrier protein [Cupriavidus metallidurans]|uniref:Acyl carrier protein n=1 Tax=Cupriavidus metallidurans TaxID=119219 RepID=A0A482IZ81_9BURK|nr:acyl carrier protein [Cupriavidus metallidurans]